jgi:hypothetical protein
MPQRYDKFLKLASFSGKSFEYSLFFHTNSFASVLDTFQPKGLKSVAVAAANSILYEMKHNFILLSLQPFELTICKLID